MGSTSKVWVIDPNVKRSRRSQAPAPSDSESESREDSERNNQNGSALFILLAYILGPLAILATPQGRQSKFWVSVAVGSVIVSTIILWQWKAILSRFEDGGSAIFIWVLVMCLATLAGFTTWARAIILLGRLKVTLLLRLPMWIRRPWTTGLLGLIVPGLGLLIAGRPRRAACALWMVGTLLPSTFILSKSAWLWKWNQGSGFEAIQSDTIEFIFLGIGVIAFLGALTWIVQALDGVRLARSRATKQGRSRGDWSAIALLTAIVVFSVMFKPLFVAKVLDRVAVARHQDGFQIIPLYMARAAMHLDPSQPEYMMHVAEFYDDLGRHHTARIMREDLYKRWKPCVDMLQQQGMLSKDDAVAVPKKYERMPNSVTEVSGEEQIGTRPRLETLYGPF